MQGADLQENTKPENFGVEEGKWKGIGLMPGVQSDPQYVAHSRKKCKGYNTEIVTTQAEVEKTSHNWSQSHQ